MVRLWSEKVGNAKTVIEPLLQEIGPDIQVRIDGGGGFGNETVEVSVKKGDRQAHCVVTFEAWENARKDPEQMVAAFRKIVGEMDTVSPLPAYLLTSRGLTTQPADKGRELLRDMAAGIEADILAEQFFKHGLRK